MYRYSGVACGGSAGVRRGVIVGAQPQQPDAQDQAAGPQFPGVHQGRPEGGQRARRRWEWFRWIAEK